MSLGPPDYFDQLKATLDDFRRGLTASLKSKNNRKKEKKKFVAPALEFGGPGEKPERETNVPGPERSEFGSRRPMGDWAELISASAFRSAVPEWKIVPYGDRGRTPAGNVNFREAYLNRIEDVRLFGKRPDLLVRLIAPLSAARMNEVWEALHFAFDLPY